MRTRTSTTQGQQRARGGSNNSSEPNRGDVELEDLETVTRGYQEEEEGDVFARASGGAEGAAPLSPPPSYSDTMDASVNWEKPQPRERSVRKTLFNNIVRSKH